jgi:diphthamide synthase (EF-2-diphthine--ammonia ligase)
MCGRDREYETHVVDWPLHKKRFVLDDVETVETDDGVGV